MSIYAADRRSEIRLFNKNDLHSECLADVLRLAEPEDLHALIDYITDEGKGRVALSKESCERLFRFKSYGSNPTEELLQLIAFEVQAFGGNSIANFIRENTRGRLASLTDTNTFGAVTSGVLGLAVKAANLIDGPTQVLYAEILRDVAEHLNVPFHKDASTVMVEEAIITSVVSKALEDMSPEELKEFADQAGITNLSALTPVALAGLLFKANAAGFGLFKGALIIAQAVSKAFLGKGLSQIQLKVLMKGLKFFTGPVGWAVTGVMTAAEVASPAYRVTVPCIIQIAYIRQKALAKAAGMDESMLTPA